MATVLSTNMSLPVPVVGSEAGPAYAIDLNACLALLDQHDHTPGNGVRITPLGMSITSDLAFGSNNATALRTIRFTNQSSSLATASDLGCLYEQNGDLYYVDASGNQIRMTLSGAVNTSGSGNITGMGATTATVNYVSATKTFTFLSNTGVPGGLNFGPLYLSPAASNTFNIAVTSPTLAASYTLTLPATAPASQALTTMSTAGTLTSAVPDATLTLTSTTIGVAAAGITSTQIAAAAVGTTQLAAGSVTQAKRAALGQQVSSSSGAFSTSSGTFVDITNLTVTITTTGRPVMLMCQSDGTASATSRLFASASGFNNYKFLRGATEIGSVQHTGEVPPSTLQFIDIPAAGTYTYKIQINTSTSATIATTVLVAYEL